MKTLKKALWVLGGLLGTAVVAALLVLFLYFPNVDPAPDLDIATSPDRVQRGAYLAHSVTLCIDCHSRRNWQSYSGPPVSGTWGMGGEEFSRDLGFPGIFYSKNITPAGIGDWTDGELYRTITSGVDREGKALFPVMPYHLYNGLHDEDIYSIIAYLRTLEPIPNEIPARTVDFPFSLILRTLPVKKAVVTEIPPKSDFVAYGAYVTQAAGCVECHTPVKDGQLIKDQLFSGGREFVMPGGTVTSSNLTPDKTGLGDWTADQFVATFRQYADSTWQSPQLAPSDPNTLMPWTMYGSMTEEDLRAIFAYLQTLPPRDRTVQKFSSP